MNDTSPSSNRPPDTGQPRLTWPPPGLEPVHGIIGPLIGFLAAGGLILVVPLIVAAGRDAGFASFGIYGTAVWIPLITTCVGIVIVIAGWERLGYVTWVANRAVRDGLDWPAVLYTLVDGPKDTGFLIQGARIYSDLPEQRRGAMLRTRLTAALCYLTAALWMPVAFAIGLLLGRFGVIGAGALWYITLLPAALLAGTAVAARVAEDVWAQSTRRKRAKHLASDETTRRNIDSWNQRLSTVWHVPVEKRGSANPFRIAAIVTTLLAIVMVPTVFLLSVSTTVGSVFAAIALPDFSNVMVRSARVDMFRRYRLPPDEAVTALAAGEALHALYMAPVSAIDPPLREPARWHRTPWLPVDSLRVVPLHPGSEGFDLFERAVRGLSAAERSYLESVAGHPGRGEIAVAARAASADIIAARYDLPFTPEQLAFDLPIPPFRSGVDGARAHMASAALELAAGRVDAAETTIREVVSLGFLTLDESPTAFDAIMGMSLVEFGGDAIEALYRATGRERDADELAWVSQQSERVARRAGLARPLSDFERELSRIPELVADTTMPRGLRWELFSIVASLTPCLNMHAVVFGQGASYDRWVDSSRRTLVKHPGDEAFLELSQRGFLGESTCGIRSLVTAFGL